MCQSYKSLKCLSILEKVSVILLDLCVFNTRLSIGLTVIFTVRTPRENSCQNVKHKVAISDTKSKVPIVVLITMQTVLRTPV